MYCYCNLAISHQCLWYPTPIPHQSMILNNYWKTSLKPIKIKTKSFFFKKRGSVSTQEHISV